jgi:hypothetical protein
VKVREAGRIVSVAVIIAVGVNSEGMREVLGMAIGPSEAEPKQLQGASQTILVAAEHAVAVSAAGGPFSLQDLDALLS